jgi:hemerythrin-like domain-containing protein
MNNFLDLLVIHRQLDELFFEHQRALMRLDLDAASRALANYESGLLAHIADEEELMLPIYRERVQPPVGGAMEIFFGEHEKLRQYLSLFKEEMIKLRQEDDLERGVLFLIDSQHIFKRLLVHHDTREKNILYRLLNECTDASEKETLLSALRLPARSAPDF